MTWYLYYDWAAESLQLNLRSIPRIRENKLSRRTASSLGKLSCPTHRTYYEAQKTKTYIELSSSKIETALLHKLAISHDVHRVQGKNVMLAHIILYEYIHQLINVPTSTNTHFPSLVLTFLHLYSLPFTLVPYMWASMTFLPYIWASMTFWPRSSPNVRSRGQRPVII